MVLKPCIAVVTTNADNMLQECQGSLPVTIFKGKAHGLPTVLKGEVGSLVCFLCTFG